MEETLLIETKKSGLLIIGDYLKIPWIFLVFLLIYFAYFGIVNNNFLGLLSILGIFIVSAPIKYFMLKVKTFTLTNYRMIIKSGKADHSKSLELTRVDYVGLEYPKLGKSLGYGHVVVRYDRDKEVIYKNLIDPYDFAKEITEAMRYAKAAALRNNAS